MIAHARHDELGRYTGGRAGDQDGSEVAITKWYSRPWNVVLRCTDDNAREKIAIAAEQCAKNNHIGYDQGQRTTLYTQAKKVGWDISKITVDCETDCSAMVAVCVNAAGITVSKDIYTGNERKSLLNTGKFEALADAKYLESENYILRGDVLLYEGHHTAIALDNGQKINMSGWKKQPDGTWKYVLDSGVYAKNKWMLIDGRWYAFDGSGTMITGWFKSKDEWYYLNPADGAMISNQWLKYKNNWYYLDKDGKMVTDCYIWSEKSKSYFYVDKNGVWDEEKTVKNLPGPGVKVIK